MEASYRYFENRDCKFYPCHKNKEEINCLFCYCPMYPYEECLGTPGYILDQGKRIKDCEGCTYPHEAENYEAIMDFLRDKN